jgi:hypothetical protein
MKGIHPTPKKAFKKGKGDSSCVGGGRRVLYENLYNPYAANVMLVLESDTSYI